MLFILICLRLLIPVQASLDLSVESIPRFNVNGMTNNAKTTINFYTKGNLRNLRFFWDHGDGQREWNVTMTAMKHTHVYQRRGAYNARLTVLSTLGDGHFTSVDYKVVVGEIQMVKCYPLVLSYNEVYSFSYKFEYEERTQFIPVTLNTSVDAIDDYNITETESGINEVIENPCGAIVRNFKINNESLTLKTNISPPDILIKGETVTFKLYGSFDFIESSCKMDFGDSRHSREYAIMTEKGRDPMLSSWTHEYLRTGTYNAVAYCWNKDTYIESNVFVVEVAHPLSSFDASTNASIFDLAKSDDLILILETNKSVSILDTQVKVDWGDGTVIFTNVFELVEGENVIPNASHMFTSPGDYTITVQMSGAGKSFIETYIQKVSESLHIELVLNDTHLSEETFTVNITNLPVYDVSYILDLGDDKIDPYSYAATEFTNFFAGFPSDLTYFYLYGGNFTVNLTSFNTYHSYSHIFDVVVLQGTPKSGWELTLSREEAIIVEESSVSFQLSYSIDQSKAPTVVVNCSIDFGDGSQGGKSIITFPSQTKCPWVHMFNETGNYSVILMCENKYSSHNLTLNVTVLTYNKTEYIFTYVEALGVSGTLASTNKEPTHFSFSLYDISEVVFPHWIQWDFGDGTTTANMLTSWNHSHVYVNRDVYDGEVTVFSPKGNFTYQFKIYIGVSNITIDPPDTTANTLIEMLLSERRSLEFEGSIDYGDGNKNLQSCVATCNFSHAYEVAGTYYVKYILTVGHIVETLIFENVIFIDNPVVGLNLSVKEETINQPPGRVEVIIGLESSAQPINFMECKIDLGDFLDLKMHYLNGSLQPSHIWTFKEQYKSLGGHIIIVNCTNRLGSQLLETFCMVRSECFGGEGIFDRQYADPKHPLLIMASTDIEVTSRAIILCNENPIYFQWTLWTLNEETFDRKQTLPISQPMKDSYLIKKGIWEPDMYSLELNVSTELKGYNHWLGGMTYIRIIGSPLVVKIKGGTVRATGNPKAVIDARSVSFDPDKADANENHLLFKWMCGIYFTSSVNELDMEVVDSPTGIDVPCSNITKEIKPGILQFDNLNQTDMGYSFSVSVRTKAKQSDEIVTSYVQFTKGAPAINIECLLNCEVKIARTAVLVMEVVCEFCFEAEFYDSTIKWDLQFSGTNNSNLDLKTMTDIAEDNPTVIIFKKNTLSPCQKYRLKVEVDMSTRERKGVSYKDFVVNCPPSDGTCETYPKSGEARNTEFRTTCKDWVDDGYALDGKKTPSPFIYKFYINQGEYTLPLFRGAQAMTPKEPLPVITGTKGGRYTIICRIFDSLNDYAEFNTTIQLIVPKLNSLEETGDANQAEFSSGMAKDTSILSKQLVQTTYSSSILQTVDISSLDAFFSEISNNGQDSSKQKEMGWDEIWSQFLSTRQDKKLKEALTTKYKTFVGQLNEKRDNISSLNGHGLESLGEALATILHSEDTVDFEMSEAGSDLINSGISMLESLSAKKPFPLEDKLDNVVYALTGALDTVFNKNSPSFYSGEVNVNSVELNENDRQGLSLLIMNEQAAMDDVKIQKSEEILPSVENATDKLLEVMLRDQLKGQQSKTIQREGVSLNVRKITARTLKDSGFQADKFSMDFPSSVNSSWNGTDVINLKAVVTKKNLYSFSKDGSSHDITSPILSLRIDDSNGTSRFDGNMTLKINRETPEFKMHHVNDTRLGEEGLCHHQFQVKKTSDTTFVYVNIGRRGSEVSAYVRNGLAPVTYAEDVKRFVGEYIDFNSRTHVTRRKKRAESVVIRFAFKPGDLEIGLTFLGLDFGDMTDTISYYSFLAYADGCRVWDREKNSWDNTSCKISVYSSPEETVCDCRDAPGHNFASSFYVPPNLINFDLVFRKFDAENASVYGTLICLFVVFGLAAVWARRKGRMDEKRWRVGYLEDNFVDDNYYYLLTVHTGLTGSSGTKSEIRFIVTGETGDTGVRILSDGKRHMETGSVMSLVMATPGCIGKLKFLRIWHDNSGKGADQSWYLSKFCVDDIQTNTRSVFLCDQWLAMDKADGLIDRIIPASFEDDLMTFSKLFSDHSRVNLSDAHLWLSVWLRPERSMFTRVQRVISCLATLLLAMISSALFYKPEDPEGVSNNNAGSEVQLGTLRFSMTTLFTSFVGLIVTVPPIVLIVFLFKARRPWTGCGRSSSCCRRRRNLASKDDSFGLTSDENSAVSLEDQDPLNSRYEKNYLPPWCLIVAWVLLITIILVCSFCLLLYSMQWGKTVSQEWLASFVLSFFESIFILDPIKVLLLAVLFALCMRKLDTSHSDLSIDIVQRQSVRLGCKEIDPTVLPPDPIPEQMLENARKRKQEESLANSVFIELLLYVLFVFCIFSVSYGNRDARSFNLNDHIQSHLVKPPFRKARQYYGSQDEVLTWSKLRTLNDVYTWLNGSMQDTLLPWFSLNGQVLPWTERLFIKDLANYRVGPVRLRQARMPRDLKPSSESPGLYLAEKPYNVKQYPTFLGPKITNQGNLIGHTARSPAYEIRNEETGDYCWKWNPLPCSEEEKLEAKTSDAWKHRSTRKEKSFPVIGKFAIYSGAAYVLDLNFNRHIITDVILNELRDNSWLDIQTRAVFVEFTLYNSNVNLLTSIRLAAEFPEYGGTFTWTDIKPMRVYDHTGGLGAFMILCQIISVIVMIVFTVKVIKNLKKQRLQFFTNGWNVLDLLITSFCLIVLIVYITRKVFVTRAMGKFKSNPKVFVNFYEATLCDDFFGWLLAIVVFLCTLRIMRILGYNQRIVMIAAVLRRAGPGLLSFSVLFGLIICTFMSTGYALFHSNLKSFMSLWESNVTIIYLLMGKSVFNKMITVSAILSRLYFFLLAVIVVFVFLTIFQAILNFTITEVHSDVTNAPVPYGIMDVIHKIYSSLILDNRAVELLKRWNDKTENKEEPKTKTKEAVVGDATQVRRILTVLRMEFYNSMEKTKCFDLESKDSKDRSLLYMKELSSTQITLEKVGKRERKPSQADHNLDKRSQQNDKYPSGEQKSNSEMETTIFNNELGLQETNIETKSQFSRSVWGMDIKK